MGIGPITKRKIRNHLLQFFIVGLVMGVSEDLLAIHFATDAKITPRVFKIAFLVALPFAFISEILIDFGIFRKNIQNHLNNHQQEKNNQKNHEKGQEKDQKNNQEKKDPLTTPKV